MVGTVIGVRDEKIRASCVPLFAFLEHLLLFGWRILLPRGDITDRQHLSLVSGLKCAGVRVRLWR